MLAEGGLATSVTYFAAKDIAEADSQALSETITTTLAVTLALASAIALALYSTADAIIAFFDKLSSLQQADGIAALRIGVASLAALLVQNVLIGLLQGMQRYGISNLLSTAQVATSTVGFIVIGARGGGVADLMTWQVIISLASLFIYAMTVRYVLRSFQIRLRLSTERFTAIWKYGLMTWVGTLGGVLFSQLDRVVVAKALGAPTLAVYGAITGAVRQINTFTAVPVQPLLPQLAQLSARRDTVDEIRVLVRKALHVNTLGALALGILLFTLAPLAISLLLDRPASVAEVYGLRVATVIYSLFSINGVGYYVLLAVNGVRSFMLIQLVSGVAALVLIAVGTRYGMMGAIVGNAGYLGVWAFSVLGMRYVNVEFATWFGWIRPPLLWTAFAAIVTVLIPQNTSLLLMVAALQCGVLALWFAGQQPVLFYTLTHFGKDR